MSGYVCPCCGEISNIFSTGGGQELARKENLNFLGSMPVDTALVTLLDAAENTERARTAETTEANGSTTFEVLDGYYKTSSWPLFKEITKKIVTLAEERTTVLSS